MEHEGAVRDKTVKGRTPEYRSNRQNPIDERNAEKYYPKGGYKSACPP
jgi:hypothetical protein